LVDYLIFEIVFPFAFMGASKSAIANAAASFTNAVTLAL